LLNFVANDIATLENFVFETLEFTEKFVDIRCYEKAKTQRSIAMEKCESCSAEQKFALLCKKAPKPIT
jgi:hypothetical protein